MKNIVFVVLSLMLCVASVHSADAVTIRVNINSATVAELQQLKGIGAKTAQAIVQYRNTHGAFKSVQDLQRVKGVGKKKLAHIEHELEVGEDKHEHEHKHEHEREHDDHEHEDD